MDKVPNMISTKDLDYLKDMIMKVSRMHGEHSRKIKNILMEGYNEQN